MAEGIAYVPETEPGHEVQFCPIRNLPIIRSQRVRALPGYHLLCLAAGREALARGYYTAFQTKFQCTDLEYLHIDDKVFICPEDHKAFLNQMSMQYHRYIRYELEERKAERKRLRERAVERLARSAAQLQQRQQAQQLQQAQQAQQEEQARQQDPRGQTAATDPVVGGKTSSLATAPRQGEVAPDRRGTPVPVVVATPAPTGTAVGTDASNQLLATNDPYLGTAAEDPYAAVPTAEDPYLDASEATAATADASATPAATSPPNPAATPPATTAAEAAPTAAVHGQKRPAPPRKPMAAEEEDLYGDVADREVKSKRASSTYAAAVGAMLVDDFDEDDQ